MWVIFTSSLWSTANQSSSASTHYCKIYLKVDLTITSVCLFCLLLYLSHLPVPFFCLHLKKGFLWGLIETFFVHCLLSLWIISFILLVFNHHWHLTFISRAGYILFAISFWQLRLYRNQTEQLIFPTLEPTANQWPKLDISGCHPCPFPFLTPASNQ